MMNRSKPEDPRWMTHSATPRLATAESACRPSYVVKSIIDAQLVFVSLFCYFIKFAF
jgi:hypothetical protein